MASRKESINKMSEISQNCIHYFGQKKRPTNAGLSITTVLL